jgi:membrane-associated HD superfamily phosphohydrolase
VPTIGIRKTATGYLLTKPNLEKTAVVSVEENLLDSLLVHEMEDSGQEILEQLYKKAKADETWYRRASNTFRTENAFWHIQGIITTTMFLVSSYFLIRTIAGAVAIESVVPTPLLSVLILIGLGVATYSFYALFTKRRARKRRAALFLFMVYLYQLFYLNIVGEGIPIVNITFVSLAAVSVALFSEWSRPSK